MSDTDSFIEEVSEEVRKDKLFGFLQQYAWAIGLVLFAIVGGAAYNEYSKASTRAAYEARGDALMSVLQEPDPQSRLAKLSDLEATVMTRLFRGQAAVEAGNRDEAVAIFSAIAEDSGSDEIYRDMAALKSVYLTRGEAGLEEQRALLDPLTTAGRPFRLLALEARAVAFMQARERDAALEDLTAVLLDPETQQNLSRRASQLILVLGGELPEMPGGFLPDDAATE